MSTEVASEELRPMGDLLPYKPPAARLETTAYIGMVIFLASWAMMFAALFFAYAFLRSRAPQWPPPGVPVLPVVLPAVNTAVLLLSSAVLQWGVWSVRRAKPSALGWSLVATVALGALFLALQIVCWVSLHAQGLTTEGGGPYASVFYGLTWFHALHVLVGLVGLGLVARRAFQGKLSAAKHLPVRLSA